MKLTRKRAKKKIYVCCICKTQYKAFPSGPPATHKYCCGCYCVKSNDGTLPKEDEITWTRKGWKQGDREG